MRNEKFKAKHRGGPLKIHNHRLLSTWAADCAERVLSIFEDANPEDNRPRKSIENARAWAQEEMSVGEARNASISAHAAARESGNIAAQYAARSAGHAAATAHMADHALRSAMYALKAIKETSTIGNMDNNADQEEKWQTDKLPAEIRELVLSVYENL